MVESFERVRGEALGVEMCEQKLFSKNLKCSILIGRNQKGGNQVADEEKMVILEEENRRLKEDNDKLLEIVVQMRVTLNRLVLRYVTEDC